MPKIYPGASAMSRMEPGGKGRERKRPISSSKSNRAEGWKVGLLLLVLALKTPFGRQMGVPEMRRLDVRPL